MFGQLGVTRLSFMAPIFWNLKSEDDTPIHRNPFDLGESRFDTLWERIQKESQKPAVAINSVWPIGLSFQKDPDV